MRRRGELQSRSLRERGVCFARVCRAARSTLAMVRQAGAPQWTAERTRKRSHHCRRRSSRSEEEAMSLTLHGFANTSSARCCLRRRRNVDASFLCLVAIVQRPEGLGLPQRKSCVSVLSRGRRRQHRHAAPDATHQPLCEFPSFVLLAAAARAIGAKFNPNWPPAPSGRRKRLNEEKQAQVESWRCCSPRGTLVTRCSHSPPNCQDANKTRRLNEFARFVSRSLLADKPLGHFSMKPLKLLAEVLCLDLHVANLRTCSESFPLQLLVSKCCSSVRQRRTRPETRRKEATANAFAFN